MKKNRNTIEYKLEDSLVSDETKRNVMYSLWCKDIQFYGFKAGEEGHTNYQRKFLNDAKQRAYAIQFESVETNYSRAAHKVFKRLISRRLTVDEVVNAVKIEYNKDYALIQFRIIYNELKANNNPLADLLVPVIESYKWVGIFYGEKEYDAFKYITNELQNRVKKILFKILWSKYNKILIKCTGTKWDEWVHKEYFPEKKITKIAGKYETGSSIKLETKIKRITRNYSNPQIFEYHN